MCLGRVTRLSGRFDGLAGESDLLAGVGDRLAEVEGRAACHEVVEDGSGRARPGDAAGYRPGRGRRRCCRSGCWHRRFAPRLRVVRPGGSVRRGCPGPVPGWGGRRPDGRCRWRSRTAPGPGQRRRGWLQARPRCRRWLPRRRGVGGLGSRPALRGRRRAPGRGSVGDKARPKPLARATAM